MAMLNYKHKTSPKAAEGSVAEEKGESRAEAKAEGDKPGETKTDSPAERHAEERRAAYKRHEAAVRDHNGSVRDARRKLDAAHEKELIEQMQRHQTEMTGGAASPGEAPA